MATGWCWSRASRSARTRRSRSSHRENFLKLRQVSARQRRGHEMRDRLEPRTVGRRGFRSQCTSGGRGSAGYCATHTLSTTARFLPPASPAQVLDVEGVEIEAIKGGFAAPAGEGRGVVRGARQAHPRAHGVALHGRDAAHPDGPRSLNRLETVTDLGTPPPDLGFHSCRTLDFLRGKAANGHRALVFHCMWRAAFALSALIRFCQNGLAVPNTL